MKRSNEEIKQGVIFKEDIMLFNIIICYLILKYVVLISIKVTI